MNSMMIQPAIPAGPGIPIWCVKLAPKPALTMQKWCFGTRGTTKPLLYQELTRRPESPNLKFAIVPRLFFALVITLRADRRGRDERPVATKRFQVGEVKAVRRQPVPCCYDKRKPTYAKAPARQAKVTKVLVWRNRSLSPSPAREGLRSYLLFRMIRSARWHFFSNRRKRR